MYGGWFVPFLYFGFSSFRMAYGEVTGDEITKSATRNDKIKGEKIRKKRNAK